jgi:hypothetical protein
MARLYSNENFPLPVVEKLRVLACVQEVAATPGDLLAWHFMRNVIQSKAIHGAVRSAIDARLSGRAK